MSERRVPLSDEEIQHPGISAKALRLYAILVSNQTSPDGAVFYGKEIGYAWIVSRWVDAPALRSLKRYMAELKDSGFVKIRREFRGGMRIWLPKSRKFATAIPAPAEQLSLLSPVAVMKRAVNMPTEILRESCESPDFNRATVGTKAGPTLALERSIK